MDERFEEQPEEHSKDSYWKIRLPPVECDASAG
jgi:hypothetical protein